MKNIKLILLSVCALLLACGKLGAANEPKAQADSKVVVAYVTSWSQVMPDPMYMTHINYAFGHVSETFNGVNINNEERLKQIVALKKQNPALKVLLSIGGWGSGRFSEMAANAKYRAAFARDCQRVVKQFGLDGIDIDWEYPTSNAAGISSSPEDTQNFTLMMRDIRKAIGTKKQLTLATVASAQYIDFKAILPYIDFVNIMSYDMGNAPILHSGLYESEHTGGMTGDKAVKAHLAAGVPAEKLVMGLPFYGRGGKKYPNFQDFNKVGYSKEFRECWDDKALVPYLIDKDGELVFGYENVRSLAIKCQYILKQNLHGGMYWDYSGDNEQGDLRRTVYEGLMERKPFHDRMYRVLVLTESAGQHKPFSDAAIKWLVDESKVQNLQIQVLNSAALLAQKSVLDHTDLVIQLDFPPYTWPKEAEQNFIHYMNEGRGSWIGFHHATLLGEFDGFPLWQWFSDFMGGIRFQNYIAPLADGTVVVEDKQHPVMNGVDDSFVLLDDEWYTYDKSPRPNVRVLAHVDESAYTPASDVKMGDHPVVWTNEKMAARNVYFQMGHSPKLFQSDDFVRMLHNAIAWALGR